MIKHSAASSSASAELPAQLPEELVFSLEASISENRRMHVIVEQHVRKLLKNMSQLSSERIGDSIYTKAKELFHSMVGSIFTRLRAVTVAYNMRLELLFGEGGYENLMQQIMLVVNQAATDGDASASDKFNYYFQGWLLAQKMCALDRFLITA